MFFLYKKRNPIQWHQALTISFYPVANTKILSASLALLLSLSVGFLATQYFLELKVKSLTQAEQAAARSKTLDSLEHSRKEAELKKKRLAQKLAQQWVDSVYANLSTEQRIGQLFMLAAYSNKDETHYKEIERLIEQYQIGGLIFFQGAPYKQAELTNRYQAKSPVPLLIAIDAEWGLGMRLDSTISYPRQMILGAMNDPSLVYEMGKEVARQCKRIGIHVNFAPVVDVNSNPKNPVIGTRSFGENKEKVATNGIAYAKGMQHQGVIACAKHFPGHGDTDSDSHYTLPQLSHDKKRLNEVELYPFKRLFADSVMSVMVAHLQIPAYDKTPNLPTTLSYPVVTTLLRDTLGFEGLVFTDAMNMKGITNHFSADEANLKALLAGNDILLHPANISKAIEGLLGFMKAGKFSEVELEKRVKKILHAKYFVGLNRYKPIDLKGIHKDLNSPQAKLLNETLHQKAVTIVRNECELLPFKNYDSLQFASIAIGEKSGNAFQKMLSNYAPFQHFTIGKAESESQFAALLKKVEKYNTVIVGLFGVQEHKISADFGITPQAEKFIRKLSDEKQVILVVFGNAYSLEKFEDLPCLVAAYLGNETMQKAVPQVLFNAISTKAQLPISAGKNLPEGLGIKMAALGKLRYTDIAEAVGFDSQKLHQNTDKIVAQAISAGAMPSCQLLVAKAGTVVLQKSYGRFTYDSLSQRVENEHLYDLASVTKVAATLPALMQLFEKQAIDLDLPIVSYLPELAGTNKADITIRKLLLHKAGLVSGMPGWHETFGKAERRAFFYQNFQDEAHCLPIAGDLYGQSHLPDSLWQWVIRTPRLQMRGDGSYPYRYSDLSFFILQKIVERVSGEPLAQYLDRNLYRPLALPTLGYEPLFRFEREQMVPTEKDALFRKQTVQGTVHDYAAALNGGVAGHAGVFSAANDLAILMQMFIQGGFYGGKRYFQPETIAFFTEKEGVPYSRRTLGFELAIHERAASANRYLSPQTFGHRGFTGTCVWVDPTKELIYVFLSNRSYPNARNNTLNKLAIRSKLHEAIYEALN